jgi:hypothetical protein
VELSNALQPKLNDARAALKGAAEKILEADLVTYKDIALAILGGVSVVAPGPKPVKAALKRALQTGLAQDIANEIISKSLPPEAIDAINGRLRSVMAKFEPAFAEAQASLDSIVQGFEEALRKQLPAALVQMSPEPGASVDVKTRANELSTSIRRSQSERLGDSVAEDMSRRTGMSFEDVHVHHDAAAQQAAESIHAKAFTLGNHVYFGPGRFAPQTQSGKRLLAHELTHVRQQRGVASPTIQPDWKDRLDRLAKKVSERAIAEIKGAKAPSAAIRKERDEIRTHLEKFVLGKVVVSTSQPPLPPKAYSYVTQNGKIVRIARHPRLRMFIPPLVIDKKTRRVQLRTSVFDPKGPDRAALRRAMNCSSTEQAHHIIPLEFKDHDIVKAARDNGWRLNGRENGICLTSHSGPHDIYSGDVGRALEGLMRSVGTDWKVLEEPFKEVVTRFRNRSRRAKALK